MTLTEFFNPLTVREAIRAFDESELLHIRRQTTDEYGTVLNWGIAAHMIQQRAGDPTRLRVLKDGTPVPVDMLKGDRAATSVSGAALRKLARQGVSVVMSGVESATPVLQQLSYEAERHFGCPVTFGMIATFGRGRALKPHFDDTDIIALQIAGEKNWKILGERVDGPAKNSELRPPDLVTREFSMKPGHLMLLPRGSWHCCWSEEDTLQFSILIHRHTGEQFIRWLAEKAAGRAVFHRAAPLARDSGVLAAFEADWKAGLLSLAGEGSLAEFLADRDRRVPVPVHLDVDRCIDPADRNTVVSLLVRRRISIPRDIGEPLRMGGIELPQTPAIRCVVEVLNDAISTSAGALIDRLSPSLDPRDVWGAIRQLDAAGLTECHRACTVREL